MSGTPGGSGAALGSKVLRYSSIHSLGVVITNVLVLISTVVLANFLEPAQFGRLGLLMFFSALLNLAFNIASKQGTMKRVFGGGDDDDDDDDESSPLSESTSRSLATGLGLTAVVSAIGTAIVIGFADSIGDAMLGGATGAEVTWAAVAGGSGAVFRLASISIWMEQRPYPYIAVEAVRPLLTLAVTVPLLISDPSVESAIAGTAIGSGFAAAFAVANLWRSIEPCFDPREALTIYRRGAIRVPIVLSFWTVGYLDIFLLSRFVSDTDLGVYLLASRAGFLVSFLPAGYRKALRPLRRSTTFAAVEAEYGHAVSRGIQFGYFVLMLTGVMLLVTLFASVMVRVAPDSYSEAAPLIPLLSAGLVAPTTFRMINKSAKFGGKRYWFLGGAVAAAITFVVGSLLLIPVFDLRGAPIAMLLAFAIPSLLIIYKAQTGRTPTAWPVRTTILAVVPAVACAIGFELIQPSSIVLEIALAGALMVAWAASLLVSGAIPSYHRVALAQMARAFVGRGAASYDTQKALAALKRPQRRALRRAAVRHQTPAEAVEGLLKQGDAEPGAALVRLLRRAAAASGPSLGGAADNDAAIGEYLFGRHTAADRSKAGRGVLDQGTTDATELHAFETLVEQLAAAPPAMWRNPSKFS